MGRTGVSGGGGIARKLSRRKFLKVGGAGLAGAALLGVSGCGGEQGGGAEEVVFSFFPDPSGSVQALIDRFNEENEGGVQVRLREIRADCRARSRRSSSKAGSSGLRGACAGGNLTSGAGRSPEAL